LFVKAKLVLIRLAKFSFTDDFICKEGDLKEKGITCKLPLKAGEDQMIAGGIFPPEESPSSAGQDGR